jgi:hypothetical protein
MKQSQFTFKRYEKKYLLTTAQYQTIRKALERYMQPDEYGQSTVCNVYYDTPDFALVRASIEQPVYKEKLRVRSYGIPGEDDKVFIEIKKKYEGVVYKRRVHMTEAEASAYLNDGAAAPKDSQIQRELDWFRRSYELEPKIYIAYDRTALTGRDDPDLRITFDRGIRFRDFDLDLALGDQGEALLPPDTVLMEIKIPGTAPIWLSRLLSELRIFPANFSKYGSCYKRLMAAEKNVNVIGVSNCA